MSEKAKQLPKREQINQEHKWKLEDIYSDNSLWEKDFTKIKEMSGEVGKFKGTLAESSNKLLDCLKFCDAMYSLMDKLFVYARMRRDEDNANHQYQSLADRAKSLSTEVYGASSYIVPEILTIPEEKLKEYLQNNKELGIYKHFINENLRQKAHILSEREEEILALVAEIGASPKDIFTMLNNADIKFPMIKDEDGEDIEVTKGRYIQFLESQDRKVREEAFKALYSSYIAHKNTLASTLNSNVKKNIFFSKMRKYGSSLEASLDSDNIETVVYDKLIDTVHEHLDLLHRYVALRKKALKLDELHMYDLYVPMVKEVKMDMDYPGAVDMVEKAMAPLGGTYIRDLNEGLHSGWIDVYENEGKTSGAYSWGAYLTHPYVLLNYQGGVKDVFTLAHEMGHAMHTYYSNKAQPYISSQYTIFVAEVASTVNESLLIHYLLGQTEDKTQKAYLINHYLEEFRGTVFRQVMFAEFEKLIHSKAESGEALTPKLLSQIYRELNLKYFGPEITVDEEIDMEWSRIPHFYNSFYVYKYATGFSAAAALSKNILEEGKSAVDKYIAFLSGGGSDYPLELLKKAGVDMTTPQPVKDALDVFKDLLGQLEKLI